MKKKRFLQNMLLLFFSTVFSLFLLEFLFRFALYGVDSLSIGKMNSIHQLGVSGTIQRSPYPEVVYELKPDLDTYFKLARFKTNSKGLRDKEYSVKKPTNTFRVAVIGDSFTMPAGVAGEDAFHSQVEKWLNKEDRGLKYEFINFGVGGYCLRQYWAVLKYKAVQYDPDLILIGFCQRNDYKIPPERIFHEPFQPKQKTHPFFKSFVIERIESMLHPWQPPDSVKRRLFSTEEKEYMSDFFSKMNRFSEDKNIPVVVVQLGVKQWGVGFTDRLRNIVLSNGLEFVDIGLHIQGEDFLEYTIYPIDQHPNAKANKVFAEKLYAYLKDNKLLDNNHRNLN